ncbi:SCO family protein [Winogradskyella sp. PG-2]|uniref:SCO family protein n=1 Tax=Winogradskyella sp. PG-2 TaxID=754409 RepID=UPI0004587EF7|nr:SCO family protein [Winogradskyella sp. PG-2]BAO75112.1 cytochrome oxidase biogenesis protein Sco1/SenC/PrrC, putative copper metallochaperone [Winogradskyella sp. PG-2]
MSKKSNYSYVGIAFVVLVFGIIFIPKIIDRIGKDDITRDESRSDDVSKADKNLDKKSYKSDLVYIPNADGGNKKVPSFSFIDQEGKTITNEDYLGKVYVIEFFFTTCPTICPKMNRNLIEIQNEFKDFENFGVASFTINPEVDTPQVLKAYAINYGITNPNWHLMTGNEDTIYKLANEGFYLYTAINDEIIDGFEHSGNFALIDKKGFIRSRLKSPNNPLIYYNGIISEDEGIDDEGIPQEITILKEDIAKLLKE